MQLGLIVTELRKTLSVWRGTALLVNIVLGAGLLVLPGLALERVGSLALSAWLICALVTLPLLAVFVVLGQRYPDAGGIAHFASRAFGRYAYVSASLLFLGAVLLGLPAIALTGGYYASAAFGGNAHVYALGILLLAFLLDICSVEFAGRLNQGLSWALVIFISGIAITSLAAIRQEPPAYILTFPHSLADYQIIAVIFPMIFFAFTGWEVGASLTAEFKNPQRDFPLAMFFSFLIATVIYAVMAYVAQRADLHGNFKAPFSSILDDHFGPGGGLIVSITAITLIYANLSSALWGISRMIFSLSNERLLPPVFGRLTRGQPIVAIVSLTGVLGLVVCLDWLRWLDIATSLKLAGQNFFILYGFSALALFRLSRGISERLISVLALVVVSVISVLQGSHLLYPFIIGGGAWLIHMFQIDGFDLRKRR
jgi:amino acid efflux transporter